MVAAYGKLRKYLTRSGNNQLSEKTGDDLLEILEADRLNDYNITSVSALATDYAAVGSVSRRFREIVEKLNCPVIIIAETESLLASKKSSNPNVTILIEKSKKPDVLWDIIKKSIKNIPVIDIPDYDAPLTDSSVCEINDPPTNMNVDGKTESDCLSQLDSVEINNNKKMISVPEAICNAEKILDNLPEITDIVSEETEIIPEKNEKVSKPDPVIEFRQAIKEIEKPVLEFKIVDLPNYSALIFHDPKGILSHLARRWGMD